MLGIGRLAALAALTLGARGALGGWAVVTVENPPPVLEAGGTYQVHFMVRQHGAEPISGLEPRVRFAESGERFAATPGGKAGRYTATIKVPQAQRLTLVIESGFGRGRLAELTLLPVAVVRRGETPAPMAAAERGRHLFVAKGCGTCHVNGDIRELARDNQSLDVGPALTGRVLEANYVRQRITNPRSLPPIGDRPTRMPDLELAEPEVTALVAMLSSPRVAATD